VADLSEFVSVRLGTQHPGVGTLALSRPPTNAMTRQVYREMERAAAEIAAVLRGQGWAGTLRPCGPSCTAIGTQKPLKQQS